MAEYKIAIMNRIARIEAGVELICNNPTDSIRFEFDEEWSGIAAKTARFSWEGNKIDVPFSGNVVKVPEIFQTKYVYIGVFTDNLTTTPVKVNCRYSIKCLGGKVVIPSEDVYNKIIALINDGVNANDGVGISNANVDASGRLIITLTDGRKIDCGMVKGADGKDGAGAEEYETVLEDISILKNFVPQPIEKTGNLVQLDIYQDAPLNCLTHIEPVQAGSGDPYPGGGGKNLLPNTAKTQTVNGITLTVNADGSITANGTATATVFFNIGSVDFKANTKYVLTAGISVSGAYVKIDGANIIADSGTAEYTPSADVTYSVTLRVGSGTTLTNVTFYPMIRLASVTDATYAPYANIRPISGHTGAKLTKCGKNLVNATRKGETIGGSVAATKNEDGYYTLNGTAASNAVLVICEMLLPAGTYTLSHTIESGSTDNTGNAVAQLVAKETNTILAFTRANVKSVTYTLAEDMNVLIRLYASNGRTYNNWKIAAQLEKGTNVTEFEPFRGDTFSASFGQTVYGGVLDWDKGVLTVDRAVLTLDGTEAWVKSTNVNKPNSYYINMQIEPNKLYNFYMGDFFTERFHECSHYKADLYNDVMPNDTCHVYASGNGTTIQFRDDRCTSVDAFKAYLAAQKTAGTPVQVAYKTITQTNIQLTPQEVLALHGANNVWSDVGETTVSTRKDIIWLTHALLERIIMLEKAIVSMEGKV